ncbi:hypothetical protein evm_005175 [Chilo suppressalis]|nr:hypothetical protein evm_005175 [Chilo suppressalis]
MYILNSQFLKAVLSTSRWGRPVILLDNQRFNQYSCNESRAVWRCVKWCHGCRSSVITSDNVILAVKNNHTHRILLAGQNEVKKGFWNNKSLDNSIEEKKSRMILTYTKHSKKKIAKDITSEKVKDLFSVRPDVVDQLSRWIIIDITKAATKGARRYGVASNGVMVAAVL